MSNDTHQRLAISRQPVPVQEPADRRKNWDEVYLGYDEATARVEAARCLHCPTAPCQEACPVHNDIPAALALLEKGDALGAASKFRETSNLPELCGRLCPQEKLCEGECVVGFAIRPDGRHEHPVAIGKLEAFVADFQRRSTGLPVPDLQPATGKKVAVVGAGPAGLAVAEELARLGHAVVVYDAWPEPGGVLRYGIPNFKLSKEILDAKLGFLRRIGVRFVGNTFLGRDITIDDLFDEGFHAVFLGTGASVGSRLGIENEDLDEIYAATDFLVRGNLQADALPETLRAPLRVGENVVVIGGGDTSMDCVRTAVRLGAQRVTCVYRRTEEEMRGREEERRLAREEGVDFLFLTVPLRFLGEGGKVKAIECQKMDLGEPDETGRRRPVPVPGSNFLLEANTVVLAIGYNADERVPQAAPGVEADRWNLIKVDPESGRTTRPGVFAGGDNVNGADLVVTALADGRRAAAAIHAYLENLDRPPWERRP